MSFSKIKVKIFKHKKLFYFLSKIKLFIISLYYRFFMSLFSIFRIDNNKIIVVSYSGKGYGDNGKYIVNELIKNKKYKIFWAAKKKYKESLPNDVFYVKYNSIAFLYHLSTAKVWINNSRFVYGIKKRKSQFYIQTWHSSLRLKKIEKDAEDILNPQYVKTAIADSKMINLMVSGCDFSTNIYKNSFWYNGDVLECGTPRCDLFFDTDNKKNLRKKVCKQYDIADTDNTVLILYAPTFRKNSLVKSALQFEKIVKNLNKLHNKNYKFLIRFHPISKQRFNSTSDAVDVTNYSDMQELIAISDILITDYSGCCFDMMINKKPCILFCYDLEEYLSSERSLYFNFNELPFPIAKNEGELIKIISKFNSKRYYENVEKFKEKIGLLESGMASKKILQVIDEVTK